MRFQDIPSHEGVKSRLRNLADTGRLPHAMLLQGPEGSYKLALARAFAQYLHCTGRRPGDTDSCGRCPACLQHASMNHIDTLYVFPVVKTESIKNPVSDDYIDLWREFTRLSPGADFALWTRMLEKKNAKPVIYVTESAALVHKLSLTAHAARWRVVVIWLPEKINEEAANKLLKIIEEPFPDTIFLMVSNNHREILPTIYSRTQRIEVPRLSDETVAGILTSQGIDPVEALATAHISEGNINAAMASIGLTREGEEMFDHFVSLMRLAYQRRVADLKAWSLQLNGEGRDMEVRFYANAQRLVRENFIYNFNHPELNYMTRRESDFSVNFARFITEGNVEQLISVFNKAMTDIAANANDKIVNFDVALKVCFLLKHQ